MIYPWTFAFGPYHFGCMYPLHEIQGSEIYQVPAAWKLGVYRPWLPPSAQSIALVPEHFLYSCFVPKHFTFNFGIKISISVNSM
jgi:hypothetical protein